KSLEFAPTRWQLIQQIMDQAKFAATETEKIHPEGIEIIWEHRATFPRIRLLQKSASQFFLDTIIGRIFARKVPEIPIWTLQKETKAAIREFISVYHIKDQYLETLNSAIQKEDALWSALLLTR